MISHATAAAAFLVRRPDATMDAMTLSSTSVRPSPWQQRTDTEQAIALEVLLHGPLARSDLARRLRLSPASLTRLSGPLISAGLLEETDDNGVGPSGRPTRPLRVVADAGRFIGVRLTPTEAHGVLIDFHARVLGSSRARLLDRNPDGVLEALAQVVQSLDTRGHAQAIGVSIGGLVVDHASVVSSPFFPWTEPVDLAARLADKVGVSTVVDNDVMALTRAQSWFGYGRGRDRFAVLTLGVGVGLGVVAHGDLIESPDAGLGLIGHVPLDPTGPLCPHGHRGCADAMLTDQAIAAAASVALRRPVAYSEVVDLASAGDAVAARLIEPSGRALGRLLATVANLTMADRIVVTGEGAGLAHAAAASVQAQLAADRHPAAQPVDVVTPILGSDEWARGPAVLAMQSVVHPRVRAASTSSTRGATRPR
ncbi:ROK family protein [Aestuariimicrobium soli]|uniref:ROK family protein n=1 Tax=Aestuariimicrobium soli TaxID=2035834 RepID=UPI003EB705F7